MNRFELADLLVIKGESIFCDVSASRIKGEFIYAKKNIIAIKFIDDGEGVFMDEHYNWWDKAEPVKKQQEM